VACSLSDVPIPCTCASLSTFSAVSSSLGLTTVIASPLMEPLVKFGGEVDRAVGEVKHVMGVLTMTELASDVVVERDICEPMQRSEAAMLPPRWQPTKLCRSRDSKQL